MPSETHECEFDITATMGYMACECGRTIHPDSAASPESAPTTTREPQHKCPGCGKMVDDAWGALCVVCGAPPSRATKIASMPVMSACLPAASPPVEPGEPPHSAWCEVIKDGPGVECNCGAEIARLRAEVATLTASLSTVRRALDLSESKRALLERSLANEREVRRQENETSHSTWVRQQIAIDAAESRALAAEQRVAAAREKIEALRKDGYYTANRPYNDALDDALATLSPNAETPT